MAGDNCCISVFTLQSHPEHLRWERHLRAAADIVADTLQMKGMAAAWANQ